MLSSHSFATQASLRKFEIWRQRWLTGRAMAWLCLARLLVAFVPFRIWQSSLGNVRRYGSIEAKPGSINSALRLASLVERAACRLPFETNCLPRAMALVWMLRIRGLTYTFKLAARPMQARCGKDDLHAWVEVGGITILGAIPGPWIIVLMLGA
jgi:hypothetical protein